MWTVEHVYTTNLFTSGRNIAPYFVACPCACAAILKIVTTPLSRYFFRLVSFVSNVTSKWVDQYQLRRGVRYRPVSRSQQSNMNVLNARPRPGMPTLP